MKRSAKSIFTAALATCLIGGSMSAAHGANPVQVPAGFTITGSGFGHGAGMSQYGAQGMGLDGFTASQILTHYFTGTTVDAVTLTSPNIRVGILQDRKFVAIRGEVVPGSASGGAFNIVVDANAPIAVAPGAVATFTTSKGLTQVSTGRTVVSGKKITLNWTNAQTLMHVRHGKTAASAIKALGTASCVPNKCTARYRYGTLELASGAFDDAVVDLVVVNTLRLSDEYLYGLGEVPSSWTDAAMQAQAIAGRSYAVRKTATRSGCDCQIYSTTLDQAFVGYSKEIATMGDRWVAAVTATIVNPSVDPNTAYVVQHNGTTISTYYSSSTGGKSQPTNEVWGASLPYLVTVDDPWSKDPRVNNPNISWTATIDQATLVSRLNARGVNVADVSSMTVAGNYPSGGISKINLSDSAGNITELTIAPGQPVTPDGLRTLLGTKSTYISSISSGISTVAGSSAAAAKKLTSLTKINWPSGSVRPTDYNFTGKVSPAQVGAKVKLQKRVGGQWKTVSTRYTNSEGAWEILWAGPTAGNHDLRITASNSKGTIKTSTKRVNMVGTISTSSPKTVKRNTTFTVSGKVNPGHAGVTVAVERKIGNGPWKRIARTTTDSTGNWAITRSTGSSKMTVSYRAKTGDSRLGVLVSKVKKTKVE